jgi:hypothetical protein
LGLTTSPAALRGNSDHDPWDGVTKDVLLDKFSGMLYRLEAWLNGVHQNHAIAWP